MTKRIAICIDDFGLHQAVDDAVLSLAAAGRVSATSCMVGAPAWESDAPRLKEAFESGLLDAGLHLDLTEYPIDPSVAMSVGAWMRASILRQVDAAQVEAEFRRQLDRFEAGMGRAPSHVDGHQHVHQFPVIRDVVIRELVRRYPSGPRPWLRSTRGAGRWRLKGRVIEAMGAGALERAARDAGFAHNRTLLGVYDFNGGSGRYQELLSGWLREAQDGDLLMAHVATEVVPGDEIAQPRVAEYEVFSRDGFAHELNKAGVQVMRMSETPP